MVLEEIDEAGIIAVIRGMVEQAPGVTVPIGDDAAGFRFSGEEVLLTTDSVYEGVHFRLEHFNLDDVGWKAAAAGVSDIAAMGGEPSCALVSLGLAGPPSIEQVKLLFGGLTGLLSLFDCPLVGGDVCRSGSGLSVTVTVAGEAGPGGPIRRGGSRVDDLIGVTGNLGDSIAGLFLLERGPDESAEEFPGLIRAHLRPVPQVEAGVALAGSGVTSMEDVSDGLALDLCHICDESGLGCEIRESSIPVSEELARLSENDGLDPIESALSGGEDYQLLFTVESGYIGRIQDDLTNRGIKVSLLGEMKEQVDGCRMVREDGDAVDLRGIGYDHFSG